MAQVDDRFGTAVAKLFHLRVGELPIETAGPFEDQMERRSVADVGDPDLAREPEIGLPQLVMRRGIHLVAAPTAMLDRRIAALDPGREHEAPVLLVPLRPAPGGAARGGGRRLALGRIADRPPVDRADGEAEQRMTDEKADDRRNGERREKA